MIGYISIWMLKIINGLKYFGPWFGPNKLLLLLGQVVTFGIKTNHQPKVCDESRLSENLKDKLTGYVRV